MTMRFAFIGAATFVLSASSAASQGQPQQVVVSDAVLKAMVANKPKSKTPLTARVGMARRSGVGTTEKGKAAPTSVREISSTSKRK